MEKRTWDMKRDIIFGCVTILLTLTLWSCGARKVQKTEIKEEVKTEESSKVNETTVAVTTKKDSANVIEDILEIEPINTLRPVQVMDANGKVTTYRNARIKLSKKISNVKTAYSDKTVKISEKQAEKSTNRDFRTTEKQTERKVPFSTYLGFGLLLLLVIVVIALAYYKGKIEDEISKII